MNLRLKILLTLIGVFALYVVTDAAIQQFVVFPRFLQLEEQEAKRNLQRCHQAIDRDIDHLDYFVHDWAAWDDLHQFISDRNKEFKLENFNGSMHSDSKLNLLAVLDLEGKVVHQSIRGSNFTDPVELPQFRQDKWPLSHALLQHRASDKPLVDRVIRGLMLTRAGPMAVVSRPILRTGNVGPINGTLVMGRFLDQEAVSAVAEQTAVDFEIVPISEFLFDDHNSVTKEMDYFLSKGGRKAPITVRVVDHRQLAVQSGMVDVTGKPILLTFADVDRNISLQGRAAMRFAIGSLLLAAFVVLTILLLLLQTIVISPLIKLSGHAGSIAETGDLSAKADLQRTDEFGDLAKHFDAMVGTLATTQSRLIEVSRKAGMSDVATGVLHNVGNVMTNINVLSHCMANRLKDSKLNGLQQSVDLMQEHDSDLDEFLTTDPRGQKLPAYLRQVNDHLQREQAETFTQLEDMAANLQHVQQILEAQQKLATGAVVLEVVRPEDLLNEAVNMLSASLDRHRVRVVIQCSTNQSFRVDRNKLIQVLVNLIANAKDALKSTDTDQRLITISAAISGDDTVTIEVADCGMGIDIQDLQNVFASGFTTKSEGHGHGLHYCALAAKELGGALTAKSEGAGCGSAFTLSLPTDSPRSGSKHSESTMNGTTPRSTPLQKAHKS